MALESFLEHLRKVLKPETLALLVSETGEEFDWSFVPYSRFSAVIKQRNKLQEALDEQTKDGGSQPDPEKKFTQADIDAAVKKATTELQKTFDKEKADAKVRDAALVKLREAGALDAELLYDSGRLDHSKLVFDDKGALTGVDEAVTACKKSNEKLFGKGNVPAGTGKDTRHDKNEPGDAQDAALDAAFGSGHSGIQFGLE